LSYSDVGADRPTPRDRLSFFSPRCTQELQEGIGGKFSHFAAFVYPNRIPQAAFTAMATTSSVTMAADRARIAAIDAEILSLQNALTLLQTQREPIKQRLDSYTYPVLTLPNEITSKSLSNSCPSPHSSHAPEVSSHQPFSPTCVSYGGRLHWPLRCFGSQYPCRPRTN
jgi:hypothetical protein